MAIKTRKPTGAVPWPLILIEGEEKAGKSWACAALSSSERVGQTYWIDLAEGAADEYGAVPGARYLVVEHDGSWRDILAQVKEIKAEAQRAHDAGEPPVVLVLDSMSSEWVMLSEWVEQRARRSERGKAVLKKDPDAEVPVSANYWNDANSRHRKLMTTLMTFPGIVVVTARGKEVAEMDKKGNPVAGKKGYRVEGQKGLAFDCSVWVRMYRTEPTQIVGARSVHAGIKPGTDDPKEVPDFTLEWLVFDVLHCDPRAAHVRDIAPLSGDSQGDSVMDDETFAAVSQLIESAQQAEVLDQISTLWKEAKDAEWLGLRVQGRAVHEVLEAEAKRLKAAIDGGGS
jgi:hypothetical protein